ncbi:MFS transporter [Halobacteriales archaeon SW_5_70_135]|nr:MAG: MFS transporter [Halobacteriales archaeon SW_5_70_135]
MDGNDRRIVGLVMLAHAMVHTYELSVPIFIGYWLDGFGATEAAIGLAVTLGYGAFGIGALPGGVLADLVGSRRLIAACLLGMGGAFLALSQTTGLLTVALALLLWGVAASVYHPSGLSLVSTGVRDRGSGFAYHGMAGNFGIAVGPLVTSLLLIALDWQTVAAALALPAVLAAGVAVWVDVDETAAVDAPETAADGGPDAGSRAESVASLGEFLAGTRTLFTGAFAVVFLVVIASGLYYRGVLTFLPEILASFPAFDPVEVAGVELEPGRYAYVGLLGIGMVGQYVGGRLTDRLYPPVGLAVGFGVLALLAMLFVPALSAGLVGFLAVGALLGFALFVVQPLYQATVAELTPPGTRGLSYGYTYLGVFGVGALGGGVAGVVLTRADEVALFGLLALVAAAGSAAGLYLSRRRDAPSAS